MRTIALAALTMVTALGATQADAQRLGRGAGASYPAPAAGAPAMPAPQMPRPQMNPQMQPPGMPQAGRPNPGQPGGWSGQRPPQGGWSNQGQRPPQGGWSNQGQRPPQGGWSNQGQRPPQGGWSNQGQRPQGNWSNRQRWGGTVGGHWQGGVNAPGGWNAYHRPSRGYHVPGYWYSPSFFIGDYAGYGLFAPPSGYGWYRYYDDAVLLDSRGRVYDSRDGIDWDGGYDDGGYYQQDGYAQDGGYAQSSGYSQSYQQQGYAPLPPVSQSGNVTTYSTSSGYASGGGGYVSGGYYFPGATTTVVTINPAPSVTTTTTTTEYVETTRYIAPRHVYHAPKKRYYRPVRRKCGCVVERPILGS